MKKMEYYYTVEPMDNTSVPCMCVRVYKAHGGSPVMEESWSGLDAFNYLKRNPSAKDEVVAQIKERVKKLKQYAEEWIAARQLLDEICHDVAKEEWLAQKNKEPADA